MLPSPNQHLAHDARKGSTRFCRSTVVVQFFFFLTVALLVCGLLESTSLTMNPQRVLDIHTDPDPGAGRDEPALATGKVAPLFKYTTLLGYFLQDDPRTNPDDFDFTKTNFGLVQRPYDSDASLPDHGQGMTGWQRFEHHIRVLNKAAQQKRHSRGAVTEYKLFFLGRHGNGYHNIAERYYGDVAWDCHFSALDGDPVGIMTWNDAHLSKEGRRQAQVVNDFWKALLEDQKISLPQSYYVSPLDRAMETAEITFHGLKSPFDPVVVEHLREGTGIHTCDRRSSVSHLKRRFPRFITTRDPFLTEQDEFWDPDLRESDESLDARLHSALDQILTADNSDRISITSHSGAIGAVNRVLGHQPFSLGTGAVLPVFVKVEKFGLDHDKAAKRHGGKAEGGKHAQLDDADDEDDHDDDDDDDQESKTPTPAMYIPDKSKWTPIPSCPAGLDLDTVGQKRWGMGLKEYLDGVENGTVTMQEIAGGSTH